MHSKKALVQTRVLLTEKYQQIILYINATLQCECVSVCVCDYEYETVEQIKLKIVKIKANFKL